MANVTVICIKSTAELIGHA